MEGKNGNESVCLDVQNSVLAVYQRVGTWRKVAAVLGRSSRYWWRAARGEFVLGLEDENRLRRHFGYPVRADCIPVEPCPSCLAGGAVTTHQVCDCHGKDGDLVIVSPGEKVIRRAGRHAYHPPEWVALNEVRQAAGLTWRQIWNGARATIEREAQEDGNDGQH